MSREKKRIATSEFIAARNEGMTNPELAKKFDISVANVKDIIQKLNLPKRAKPKGYELIDESSTPENQA